MDPNLDHLDTRIARRPSFSTLLGAAPSVHEARDPEHGDGGGHGGFAMHKSALDGTPRPTHQQQRVDDGRAYSK